MAGMGMRDIKRRIKSVNNTKQITKAMELVSSSKLRKARNKLEETRPYFYTVKDTIEEILSNTEGIKSKYLEGSREINKSCFIVITGDRGLCGGYNTNAIKKALAHMKGKKEVSVITIGQKGKNFFRKRDFDIDGEFLNVLENISYDDAKNITNLVMQLYNNKLVDEVYLVYTSFISTISQNAQALRLLPMASSEGINKEIQEDEEFEYVSYEPSSEALFNYLVPKYVESMIYGGLAESSASEHGARRVAMENATDNAEEMIDGLTLYYNRARQAAITQEITEIVGGAEALQ